MDDREWMYTGWFGKRDWTDEFVQKVEDFLKKAFEQGQSKAPCPCRQCANKILPSQLNMGEHICTVAGHTSKTTHANPSQSKH